MKLSKVVLTHPIRLAGMRQADVEVTDLECPELRYDERTNSVTFGGGVGRPWAQVLHWERAGADPDEHRCPDCGQLFENRQGLGSHRAKKHGSAA